MLRLSRPLATSLSLSHDHQSLPQYPPQALSSLGRASRTDRPLLNRSPPSPARHLTAIVVVGAPRVSAQRRRGFPPCHPMLRGVEVLVRTRECVTTRARAHAAPPEHAKDAEMSPWPVIAGGHGICDMLCKFLPLA